MGIARVWTVLVLATATSCSAAGDLEPRYVSLDPSAQREFDEARTSYVAGRPGEAVARFTSFVTEHPDDSLRHAAELHLGRIAADRGEHEEAVGWLERASASPETDVAQTAGRELGQTLIDSGEPARAIEVLQPFVDSSQGQEAARLHGLIAQAAEARGDEGRLIVALSAQHHFEGNRETRHALTARIREVLGRLPPETLGALLVSLERGGAAWAQATTRLGVASLAAGQMPRAEALLSDLQAGHAPGALVDELRAAIEEVRLVDWSAVGALLPLGGRARLVGEQARAGLELAAEGDEPLRLVLRDSAGADVAALVDELVDLERVAAIVGPMDGRAAEVAAARAVERGVPLITLTIRPGVTEAGPWALRAFQTNQAEVTTLAHHAIETQGLRALAVLYPDSSYGRVMRRLFEEAVAALGGAVATSQSYDPVQTSYIEVCQALAGHPHQALFIPDSARRVSLIAPALAAAGLWSQPAGGAGGPSGTRPVQLLLPAMAFDDSTLRQAGRYLQGALFATPWWETDEAEVTVAFVERYRASTGAAPSTYASQGYDALQIIRAARARSAVPSRRGLLDALLALEGAEVVGSFSGFHESGEPRAPVQLVTIDGEGARALSR